MNQSASSSFAYCLECDIDGQVISVLKADELTAAGLQQPLHLRQLVAPASQLKLADFLEAVLQQGVCMEWDMQWRQGAELVWMLVSGFKVYQSVLVVATSRTLNADQQLLEEIMRINNEQAAQIRQLTLENLRLQQQLGQQVGS